MFLGVAWGVGDMSKGEGGIMMRLDSMKSGRYSPCAAAKSAAGRCNPEFIRAHNRSSGFFVCDAQLHPSMVGRAGQLSGWPGSRVTGIATPVRLTTNERCNSSGELTKLSLEAATMATIPALAQPEITIVDGHAVTTSIAVAEYFSKRHDDVLKKIRMLECSPDFHLRNFAEVVREVPGGDGAIRKMPAYQVTRDGFAFLAMGFTGKKAAIFKENYISAFNVMEARLRDSTGIIVTTHKTTYRTQQTFTTDGVLVCSRRMGEGELCADFETFLELARRGGYLVIREDDLLRQLRGDVKSITKM